MLLKLLDVKHTFQETHRRYNSTQISHLQISLLYFMNLYCLDFKIYLNNTFYLAGQ